MHTRRLPNSPAHPQLEGRGRAVRQPREFFQLPYMVVPVALAFWGSTGGTPSGNQAGLRHYSGPGFSDEKRGALPHLLTGVRRLNELAAPSPPGHSHRDYFVSQGPHPVGKPC
jgi:hypothetical protein